MAVHSSRAAAVRLAHPLPGVSITALDCAHHFPRHWHATFGVGVVLAGAQRSHSGRGAVQAQAGDVITHNPGEVHDGAPLAGLPRRWLMAQFEAPALAALLGCRSVDGLEWHQPVWPQAPSANAVAAALTLSLDATTPAEELREALLTVVQAVMPAQASAARADDSTPGRRTAPPLHRVRERLMRVEQPVPDLDDLADLAGVTRYTLVRQFGRQHGLPPLAWQRQWRLEQARQRLVRGASLADTAAALGFSDQSHFTRLFLRSFGYTPGRYACRKDRAAPGPAKRATPF